MQTVGKESKKRKETGRVVPIADWREDGAVPTEGVWNIVSVLVLSRCRERSCRTFNIVLPDLKYETAPQLRPRCRLRGPFPSSGPILLMKRERRR